MPIFLLVGIFGALGAVLRYSLTVLLPFTGDSFPIATVTANLLGSFAITFLIAFFSGKRRLSKKVEDAIYTGFLASFTTFSTFSAETMILLQNDAYLLAIANVLISAVGGLAIAVFGFSIGKKLSGEGGEAK